MLVYHVLLQRALAAAIFPIAHPISRCAPLIATLAAHRVPTAARHVMPPARARSAANAAVPHQNVVATVDTQPQQGNVAVKRMLQRMLNVLDV
jgi:hypothetical protein